MNIYIDPRDPANERIPADVLAVVDDISTLQERLYNWLKCDRRNSARFTVGTSDRPGKQNLPAVFLVFEKDFEEEMGNKFSEIAAIELDNEELKNHFGSELDISRANTSWIAVNDHMYEFVEDKKWEKRLKKSLKINFDNEILSETLPFENFMKYITIHTTSSFPCDINLKVNTEEQLRMYHEESEDLPRILNNYRMDLTTYLFDPNSDVSVRRTRAAINSVIVTAGH